MAEIQHTVGIIVVAWFFLWLFGGFIGAIFGKIF